MNTSMAQNRLCEVCNTGLIGQSSSKAPIIEPYAEKYSVAGVARSRNFRFCGKNQDRNSTQNSKFLATPATKLSFLHSAQ